MSSEFLPQRAAPAPSAVAAPLRPSFGGGGGGAGPAPSDESIPWWRYGAALKRFKWLVIGVSAAGILAGALLTRLVKPEYEVRATVVVAAETQNDRGPIRAQQLLTSTAWIELLRSYAITEPVVRKLGLYLIPDSPTDSTVFRGFDIGDRLRPGRYTLLIDGTRYSLLDNNEAVLERGMAGDSVGRIVGMRWRPPIEAFHGSRRIRFLARTPRDAAIDMTNHMVASLPEESSFLRISLSGTDPRILALTLNAWVEEFVSAAGRLKRKNLTEVATVLRDQLALSEQQLRSAEAALEGFRVRTITMPAEGTPVASGIEQTRDPVFTNFFSQRIEAETTKRDREALQRILADGRSGVSVPDALLSLPGVLQNSDELRTALNDLYEKRARLRTLRQTYTEDYGPVRTLASDVRSIETVTIPQMVGSIVDRLQRRGNELDATIAGASRELRNIPTRTIEEMRLRRDVTVAETMYTTLQARYEEAKLAEASAVPDVTVLDAAVAPLSPSANTAPRLLLVASAAAVALAIGLALLLDRIDPRFRYPQQATNDLGLDIVGFLPTLHNGRRGKQSLLSASQLVEACRQIRMHIQYAVPGTPPIVAITSPGPGEGKSLTATNLALSFASEGKRTLLIDGDVRRGALHRVFGGNPTPGFIEHIAGEVSATDVVRPVEGNQNLWLLPRGGRRSSSPELLASARVPQIIAQLATEFDAIVIDTAPLGAGVDAYALGVAAGNILIVLRAGQSDRRMADQKLRLLDTLPVRNLGCVVNDVKAQGVYEYYSYLPGYEAADELPVLSSTTG